MIDLFYWGLALTVAGSFGAGMHRHNWKLLPWALVALACGLSMVIKTGAP